MWRTRLLYGCPNRPQYGSCLSVLSVSLSVCLSGLLTREQKGVEKRKWCARSRSRSKQWIFSSKGQRVDLGLNVKRLKVVYVHIALNANPSQRYGASPVVEDHTVLFAAQHRWTCPALIPDRQAGTRFTYSGGMEGWVDLGYIPRWFTCPQTITNLGNRLLVGLRSLCVLMTVFLCHHSRRCRKHTAVWWFASRPVSRLYTVPRLPTLGTTDIFLKDLALQL